MARASHKIVKLAWASTYNYAENSPIRYIDLWGLQKELPKSNRSWTATDNTSNGGLSITRGSEENASYLYSDNRSMSSSSINVSGDDTSLSSLITKGAVENENVLVNRFMIHWKFGEGQDYKLSNSEFQGLSINNYSLFKSWI